MKESQQFEEIKKFDDYIRIIEENNQLLIFNESIVHKLGNSVFESIDKRGKKQKSQIELEGIILKPIDVMLNLIKDENILPGIKNDAIEELGKIASKIINSQIELFYKEIIKKLAEYLSLKSLEKTERAQIVSSLNLISETNHRPKWLCEILQFLIEKEEDRKIRKQLKVAKSRCMEIFPTQEEE